MSDEVTGSPIEATSSPMTEPVPPVSEAPQPALESMQQVAPEVVAQPVSETAPAPPPPSQNAERMIALHKLTSEDRKKANDSRLREREQRLVKLVEFAKKKNKPISNNDIQIALGIPDDTATRYAKILVQRGVFKVSGFWRWRRYTLA